MTSQDLDEINILTNAEVPIDNAILLVKWSRSNENVSWADFQFETRASTLPSHRRDSRFPENDGWELHILQDDSQAYFNIYTNRVWYCYRGG